MPAISRDAEIRYADDDSATLAITPVDYAMRMFSRFHSQLYADAAAAEMMLSMIYITPYSLA